jgi:predicted ATPase
VSFTLRVENLRALRRVEWAPEGVCALVGANGSGKSTLLQVLRFLNVAVQRGVEEAFRLTFVSSYGLRSRSADDDAKIIIGYGLDHANWTVDLNPRGGSIAWPAAEGLRVSSPPGSWSRPEGGDHATSTDDERFMVGPTANLAVAQLRAFSELDEWWSKAAVDFVQAFKSIRVYHDPDIWSLRIQGSPTGVDTVLHSRGINAFAVLRMWNERREHRHRHQFVLDGLRAAFPSICGDLDFESAGQTTFVRLWPPGSELPSPIANEANGVLALLVYLCDLASGEPGGLVAIDEPENSLHPHALRVLLESAEATSSMSAPNGSPSWCARLPTRSSPRRCSATSRAADRPSW